MSGNEPEIAKLRAAVAANDDKRTPREELIKGLVLRGRFAEAKLAATELTARDPDSAFAWSLLAESAILEDDAATALAALDTAAALDPSSPGPHRIAAKAFAAALDGPRACAHFRALSSLPEATDGDRAEALRCRAIVLGERPEAVAEGQAMRSPGPLVAAMIEMLEKGESPVYRDLSPLGAVSVSLACDTDCPRIALITPRGRVISALTPSSARCAAGSLSGARQAGIFRTMRIGRGGREETVKLIADDVSQSFRIPPDGPRTIATTTIRETVFGWRGGGR